MKDERNHHGAMDKSFSEQRICIVDANYILCEKTWTRTCSGTGSCSRWQADEIQLNLETFNNYCTSKDSTFCFVQTRYNIITVAEMHSRCFFG